VKEKAVERGDPRPTRKCANFPSPPLVTLTGKHAV